MKSGLTKKRLVWVVAGLCLVILAAFAFLSGEKEPEYQGKKLSEWIDITMQGPDTAQAREAVRHIGPKGVPLLIKWAGGDRGLPRRMRIVSKLPSWAQNWSPVKVWFAPGRSIVRARRGLKGFEILGTNAVSGIAELRRIAEKGNAMDPMFACACLAYTGPNGLTALLEISRNTQNLPNKEISVVMGLRNTAYLGSNAAPAIPVLVGSLNSTNKGVSVTAMSVLEVWAKDPNCVNLIPDASQPEPRFLSFDPALRVLVVRGLGDINGSFTNLAHRAVKKACEDSDERVRVAATNALSKIEVKMKTQGGDHL